MEGKVWWSLPSPSRPGRKWAQGAYGALGLFCGCAREYIMSETIPKSQYLQRLLEPATL